MSALRISTREIHAKLRMKLKRKGYGEGSIGQVLPIMTEGFREGMRHTKTRKRK